ncbi:MAG: ABC transporter ATP-binding protein [Anaerolineaceae bacterium]|nr:ABC transporter ATP-binding protein [Anaerolineaceae bacterium]
MDKEISTIVLELKNLTKTFGAQGEVRAVDNIDLKIRQGEFITLLGPSGCGKTTTLRLIAGFEFPTSGQVILDGKIIDNVSPNKRPMSMVFQSYALFPHMSVFENIAYGLKIKRMNNDLIQERVEIATQLMNLVGVADRMPHQLSGGQQQRVSLARALVMQPRVFLFDEPLSNLDAKLRVHMRTEIHRLQQRLGFTSVYVTHDQAEAMSLSDRVVVMNNGKIEQVGTPIEIYTKPASVFVADFIGRANFMESEVVNVSETQITFDLFGQSITIPSADYSFESGDAVYLVIRPEAVKFVHDGTGIEGDVKQAEYLGSRMEYEIEVQGRFISVTDYNPRFDQLRKEGDRVSLRIPSDSFHVLSRPDNNESKS